MKPDLYIKAVLSAIALLLAMTVFWGSSPRIVKAQRLATTTTTGSATPADSACTTSSVTQAPVAQATTGDLLFYSGGFPVFTCTADLDGNGGHEVIVGYVDASKTSSSGGVSSFGTYKVLIINSNGTVRATVPVN